MTAARILRGLPFPDYLALPGVHSSTLKAIETSPRHYQRAIASERDSDAMRLGRVVHALTLTPDAPPDVAVWDGGRRAGKAWAEFCAEHAGKTIVRAEELEVAHAMRRAVYAHPKARALLSEGEPEVTITWDERIEPGERPTVASLACKIRIDWLRADGTIVELKTTRAIAPRAWAREYAARYYHAQAALYRMGLDASDVLGVAPPPPYVIAVENTAPFDVAVYRVPDATIEAGARKVRDWLRKVAECEAAGVWPGVGGDDAADLVLPAWAETDGLEDVDVSGIEGGGDGGE